MEPRLTSRLLLQAYANGYFPMPDPETGEPLWYKPDPRAILPLDGFHASKSLLRTIKQSSFEVTINVDFSSVMAGCAARPDTWINQEFIDAYTRLHRDGFAHSVEVWSGGELAGGLYGVCIGGAFFAESKFHNVSDASKIALYMLVKHMNSSGMSLLEVQFPTPHLESLGVKTIPGSEYDRRLAIALTEKVSFIPQKIGM